MQNLHLKTLVNLLKDLKDACTFDLLLHVTKFDLIEEPHALQHKLMPRALKMVLLTYVLHMSLHDELFLLNLDAQMLSKECLMRRCNSQAQLKATIQRRII